MNLVGHEIIVCTNVPSEDRDVPPGNLEEVGDDYIIVKTEDEAKGGFANEGAEWYIPLNVIVNIIHQSDCKKCALQDIEK